MSIITDEKILHWRQSQLLRCGFPFDWAHALAVDSEVDLHRAVALAKSAGHRLAWQILAPLGQRATSTELVPIADPTPAQRRDYMDRIRRYT